MKLCLCAVRGKDLASVCDAVAQWHVPTFEMVDWVEVGPNASYIKIVFLDDVDVVRLSFGADKKVCSCWAEGTQGCTCFAVRVDSDLGRPRCIMYTTQCLAALVPPQRPSPQGAHPRQIRSACDCPVGRRARCLPSRRNAKRK